MGAHGDIGPVLLLLAWVFVAWLNRRAKSARKARSAPPPRSSPMAEADQLERTHRVQEEIQRKIAERRGAVPQAPSAPPAARPPPPIWRKPDIPPIDPFGGRGWIPVETPPAPPPADDAVETERQRRLAARMKELKTAAAAPRSPAPLPAGPAAPPAAPAPWISDLRDPAGIRRAILLREVLGPPVALRRPGVTSW